MNTKSNIPKKFVRCVCMSDTHGGHRELTVPNGDILIHAGDTTLFDDRGRLRDFGRWLQALPHPYKIVVPGNHDDILFEAGPVRMRDLLPGAHVLLGSGMEAHGLSIWGTPLTFRFGAECDNAAELREIPEHVDILVTHNPPFGIQDQNAGDAQLAELVARIRPRLHVFGHIHEGRGISRSHGTIFVNASVAGEGGVDFEPLVVDLPLHSR